ncbi:MAG: polyphosphate kinase 2 family protein [Chitinophagales bacterium]
MKLKEIINVSEELSAPYRITDGEKFKLKDIDPDDTGPLGSEDKPRAKEALQIGVEALATLQDMLYAQDRHSLLLIFQAMDAAGKDGAIKHVMSGVNPQGCQVSSFKAPTSTDLDHDYMWRCQKELPERGRIGIFNRSLYEDVLVARVHPEILNASKIPSQLIDKDIWDNRYKDIRNYEKYLSRNGTVTIKFFLHISRKEQKKRFLERFDNADKNWKVSSSDIKERAFWDDYMEAYEKMIQNTATKHSPWYVIPANNKWYTRVIVAAAIIDTMAGLDLHYPKVDDTKLKEIATAKEMLLAEK